MKYHNRKRRTSKVRILALLGVVFIVFSLVISVIPSKRFQIVYAEDADGSPEEAPAEEEPAEDSLAVRILVSHADTPLSGTFTLTRIANSGGTVNETVDTFSLPADGSYTKTENLTVGIYLLHQDASQDGYLAAEDGVLNITADYNGTVN